MLPSLGAGVGRRRGGVVAVAIVVVVGGGGCQGDAAVAQVRLPHDLGRPPLRQVGPEAPRRPRLPTRPPGAFYLGLPSFTGFYLVLLGLPSFT